ncbi:MAG TPA: hypothetical protein VK779_04115, partial [Rhizomicrobium sp.]|nr:hypothetical protein [Rhizomicrobium sp.]
MKSALMMLALAVTSPTLDQSHPILSCTRAAALADELDAAPDLKKMQDDFFAAADQCTRDGGGADAYVLRGEANHIRGDDKAA